jgi:N-acetylmuramoyl-L-alanine amidase
LTFRSTTILFALLAGLALTARGLSSQAPSPPPLTALSKDGRRAIPIVMMNDQEFVGLDDLAAAFQLTVREEAGALTVSYKGKTIVLTPDQALASIAGRLVSLPAPPARAGRRWLVPVEFVARALAPIYDARLDLRKPSHLLIVGDLRVPRVTIRYEPQPSGARLTVDTTPRSVITVSQEGERLTLKIDADALDVAPLPPIQPGIVQSVRTVEPATIAVDLGPRFGTFRAAAQPLDNAMREVIDLVAATLPTTEPAPTPPAPPAGAPAPATELPPTLGQPSAGPHTIVIDPGHGGEDDGVKTADGLKEKDLTLAVARRVKSAIEARLGVRVLLTRDDDRNVPLDDRTSLANNNKADLFVSLHANASYRASTSGAIIFSAGFTPAAEQAAKASLATERVPTFGGGLRDIELVPWDAAQVRHVDASVAFAKLLQQQLQGRVPLAAHPLEEAPLRVLEPANMPAVLVEMGYLSNAAQARQLAGNDFQASFVQALLEAIVGFRDSGATPGGPK